MYRSRCGDTNRVNSPMNGSDLQLDSLIEKIMRIGKGVLKIFSTQENCQNCPNSPPKINSPDSEFGNLYRVSRFKRLFKDI